MLTYRAGHRAKGQPILADCISEFAAAADVRRSPQENLLQRAAVGHVADRCLPRAGHHRPHVHRRHAGGRRANGPAGADALPACVRADVSGPQPFPRQPARRRRRHRVVVADPARHPGAVRLCHAQLSLLRGQRPDDLGHRHAAAAMAGDVDRQRLFDAPREAARGAPDGGDRRRQFARREGGARARRGAKPRRRLRRLLRRSYRRPHRCRGQVARARHAGAGCCLHQRARRARGLHHIAARLAAAHRRAARTAAGDDRFALLRSRRVRHQHHPGPVARHERRACRRHLRDTVHRHQ